MDDTLNIFGVKDEWVTGFVPVDRFEDDIFYWMVKARHDPENAPLVMWLTGGPGCSSEVALFYEQGPWRLTQDGQVQENPETWSNVANMLFIDQPIGAGFSHGGGKVIHTEEEIARDVV